MAQFLKDEVKEKIKVSAVETFTKKGFKESSIKEIAVGAGVSVGNVYRYFTNKDALYEAVIANVYEGVQAILSSVGERKDYMKLMNPEEGVEVIYTPMHRFIELYRQEEAVFEMLLSGGVDIYYEKTVMAVQGILADSFVKFWGVDSDLGIMTRLEASALSNALIFSVVDLIRNADDEALDEVLVEFVTRLVKGYMMVKLQG